jgi:hypothetical protein
MLVSTALTPQTLRNRQRVFINDSFFATRNLVTGHCSNARKDHRRIRQGKVKQTHYRPRQALRVPVGWGSQISRQSPHEGGKFVSLTHRPPLPSGNIPGTHFCYRLSRTQGHNMTGRIMSMKNSNDITVNRTRDLPVCSAVREPTVPPSVVNRYPVGRRYRRPGTSVSVHGHS